MMAEKKISHSYIYYLNKYKYYSKKNNGWKKITTNLTKYKYLIVKSIMAEKKITTLIFLI